MQLQITKTTVKDMKKLDAQTRSRITNKIENLPFGDVKRLQGYVNHYRLRVGDYRVIFSIDSDIIIIEAVLPRGEAYKNI